MKTTLFYFIIAICGIVVAVSTADAATKISAVNHGDAIVPCGSSKIFLDGPEAFVSWMKDDKRVIYRFPINNSNTDERSFNEICYRSPDMKACRERTSLFLPHVTKDDAGFYRCRIHYNASPAVDFDFYLTIVESPGYPNVYNENGSIIDNDYIGPVGLGADITLVCEVLDSHENSVVQWERDGHRVTGSELVKPGLHRAVLKITSTERDQDGARYTCIAQAADVTPPLSKEVEIKMYLPPLSITVDLNDNNNYFEAGIPRVIDCIIKGFNPTPTIEWYLDDIILKPETHQEIASHDVMISTLNLLTKRSDNNRLLSCRAKNEYFNEVFSSSVRLQVGFKPKCVVKPQNKIEIKSAVVETAVCFVDSDPKPTSFTWTFANNKIVVTPVQDTNIPTRFKSVLSWIPHEDDIGILNCAAINFHGTQEEPCQFEIGRTDCKNERGGKTPCKHGPSDTLERPQAEMTKNIKGMFPQDKNRLINHVMDPMDLEEGSHIIENEVGKPKGDAPWWVPFIFGLGSMFLIGIVTYSCVYFVKIQCNYVRNERIALATYNSGNTIRTGSSSPISQRGLGSYHREPDVIEGCTHQTNVTITPTPFTLSRNVPTYGESSIHPICNETQTYCV